MAKFVLGQLVSYSNKNYSLPETEGEVIAINEKEIIIKFGQKKGWIFSKVEVRKDAWQYDPNEFTNTQTFYEQTISPWCMYVNKKSKNLKSLMLQYDPKQAGDRDEDI